MPKPLVYPIKNLSGKQIKEIEYIVQDINNLKNKIKFSSWYKKVIFLLALCFKLTGYWMEGPSYKTAKRILKQN